MVVEVPLKGGPTLGDSYTPTPEYVAFEFDSNLNDPGILPSSNGQGSIKHLQGSFTTASGALMETDIFLKTSSLNERDGSRIVNANYAEDTNTNAKGELCE